MAGTAWTPGPWTARNNAMWPHVTAASPNGHSPINVAECRYPADAFHRSQQVANARLIAAAPDLYEALEGVLMAYMRTDQAFLEMSAAERRAYVDAKENAAVAALAKARGVQ